MKLALLANGPSLAMHDLTRVKLPMMGMNRSWKLVPDPLLHVGLETIHYHAAPDYFDRMAKKGGLYVVGAGWPVGKQLQFGSGTFSRDVFKDGVVTQLNNVGSVAYAAIQVAYSLGYKELFMLGLDLDGPHFDGSPASGNVVAQNSLFAYFPSDLKVWVCGSPESRANLEKCDFSEVC